jgi:cytoskeletal protein CcmA (bactofilin family)
MNKHRPMQKSPAAPQNSSSVISYGTSVVGRCKTRGSVKIEGRMEGSMEAEKGISIGKDGVVIGDITTKDAVVGGRIQGRLVIASLVQLQASCDVDGEIDTGRILIEEGATVNATVKMGSGRGQPSSASP